MSGHSNEQWNINKRKTMSYLIQYLILMNLAVYDSGCTSAIYRMMHNLCVMHFLLLYCTYMYSCMFWFLVTCIALYITQWSAFTCSCTVCKFVKPVKRCHRLSKHFTIIFQVMAKLLVMWWLVWKQRREPSNLR